MSFSKDVSTSVDMIGEMSECFGISAKMSHYMSPKQISICKDGWMREKKARVGFPTSVEQF